MLSLTVGSNEIKPNLCFNRISFWVRSLLFYLFLSHLLFSLAFVSNCHVSFMSLLHLRRIGPLLFLHIRLTFWRLNHHSPFKIRHTITHRTIVVFTSTKSKWQKLSSSEMRDYFYDTDYGLQIYLQQFYNPSYEHRKIVNKIADVTRPKWK